MKTAALKSVLSTNLFDSYNVTTRNVTARSLKKVHWYPTTPTGGLALTRENRQAESRVKHTRPECEQEQVNPEVRPAKTSLFRHVLLNLSEILSILSIAGTSDIDRMITQQNREELHRYEEKYGISGEFNQSDRRSSEAESDRIRRYKSCGM